MAHVERIDTYPVKGFDRCPLESARILDGGTLEHDREYALYDVDGDVINGKRTDRVHHVSATYDPETGTLTIQGPDLPSRRFVLPAEREAAASHFGTIFDAELRLQRNATRGFVDRPSMGPSVISTATLETVSSWYDSMTLDGARRRFRANMEVGGVPAFWEDRFVGEGAPAFRIGGVRFEGVTPCGRCVVPGRDPDTGEEIDGFRETFVERREASFPEWADRDALDHLFTLRLIARVPEVDRGSSITVGDDVEIIEGT
ncbi:putative Fe-S protein [Salinarchaeum sp. Harcht-Bsk1]|uniref:MOSC domain-containing protein n=1 Tax=Salinarchaeum sp. Harcht-Bsk1 TaxID=1333523 RepID=UPI00034230FE|nr:MOSC N-terminal beta barrel domain-containing protein [Salinarchaeum sp. Harcht-Bsk1]AGN00024.1 putative Fe-S protein [Salinarchaeum sp. Harcht-Bsk1]